MQVFFDAIVSVVGIATVLQYTWSLRAHFSSAKVPAGTMLISAVVVLTLASYLYLQWGFEQPPLAMGVGVIVMAASLGLFWAAIFASREARLRLAFDAQNPHGLVSIGPYRYVRHPFYLSYLIFWAGWALATSHPLGILPLAVIGAIYVAAALGEERKFENSSLADDYRQYRKRAGFLWPKFSS